MTTDSVNTVDQPIATFSQSSNIPCPITMFENNFQTGLDKSPNEKISVNSAIDKLPDAMDDNNRCSESIKESHCYQINNSVKPHTFTLGNLKSENEDADVKYEIVTMDNLRPVTDRKYNIPETHE